MKRTVRIATAGLLALSAALAFALTGALAQASAAETPSGGYVALEVTPCC